MKTFLKRWAFGCAIAAVTSVSVFATAQQATTPKERREDRREVAKDKKELAKDRQEIAKDKKEGDKKEAAEDKKELREDKKELGEDKKERREDRRETIEDLRKNRQERRHDHIKALREKWGDTLNKPAARAELKVHAQRMARLNRARRLADADGKADKVTKVDALIQRENARHEAAMAKFKTEGAKP